MPKTKQRNRRQRNDRQAGRDRADRQTTLPGTKPPTRRGGVRPASKTAPASSISSTLSARFFGRADAPQTVQQSIPYREMYRDGICRVTDRFYTKTIQFFDITYQLAQNEDKTQIFEQWCDWLNYFDSSISFQMSFINQRGNIKEFQRSIDIPDREDDFNSIRREYADMLKTQLAKGNNGIVKTKYITFGIEADATSEPRMTDSIPHHGFVSDRAATPPTLQPDADAPHPDGEHRTVQMTRSRLRFDKEEQAPDHSTGKTQRGSRYTRKFAADQPGTAASDTPLPPGESPSPGIIASDNAPPADTAPQKLGNPKLQFAADEKPPEPLGHKLIQAKRKAERVDAKLDKARDRLPTRRRVRIKREADPNSGKTHRRLRMEKEVKTRRQHLKGPLLVSAGQEVKQGDNIARVGSTGDSTGAHLHFEVIKDGVYLNPLFFSESIDDGTSGAIPGTPGGPEIPAYPGIPMGDGSFAALLEEAQKHLGKPYVFSASGPEVFDCSGYVWYCLYQAGVINSGRTTAYGLYQQCTPVSQDNIQPGDLVFFHSTYSTTSPTSHIGIYIGGGMMIHCASGGVAYDSVDSSYWQQHLYAYGRL